MLGPRPACPHTPPRLVLWGGQPKRQSDHARHAWPASLLHINARDRPKDEPGRNTSGSVASRLSVDALAGAQQGGQHHVGGELVLLAHVADFADAELAGERLRQLRHVLQDGAELVALQLARRQRLADLHDGRSGIGGAGAGEDAGLLHGADEGQHLAVGRAHLARGQREAREGAVNRDPTSAVSQRRQDKNEERIGHWARR